MRRSSADSRVVKWRTDLEKGAISSNCERRGWERASSSSSDADEWNFYWASVHTVKQIFNPENGYRLNDSQVSSAPLLLRTGRPLLVCVYLFICFFGGYVIRFVRNAMLVSAPEQHRSPVILIGFVFRVLSAPTRSSRTSPTTTS